MLQDEIPQIYISEHRIHHFYSLSATYKMICNYTRCEMYKDLVNQEGKLEIDTEARSHFRSITTAKNKNSDIDKQLNYAYEKIDE